VSVLEGLRLAVNGLLSNRLRSALTMLGILIGVSAVILLVGVGNGASVAVQGDRQPANIAGRGDGDPERGRPGATDLWQSELE
jgi:hypothetical protein